MKKLITILSIALAIQGFSQITIDENNIINAGYIVIQRVDTMPAPSVTPGSTGSTSWNFSSINNHFMTQVNFVDASTTPYASFYPASNICGAVPSSNYYYYLLKNSTGLYAEGQSFQYMGQMVHLVMNPHQKLISFPSTYQTAFTDDSKSMAQIAYVTAVPNLPNTYTDSARVVSYYHRTSNIDAYGTITTPMGTYNSLRQKQVDRQIDSFYVHIPGLPNWFPAGAPDTTFTYKYTWWTNDVNVKFPILEMECDENDVVKRITYLFINPIQSIETIEYKDNLVYPNPAYDYIYFNFEEKATVSIYTADGKIIKRFNIDETSRTIDVSLFSNGLYIYTIENNAGLIKTGKFSISK